MGVLYGVEHLDTRLREKIADLRGERITIDEFAVWVDETIIAKRNNAEEIWKCHTPLYMSFASRSAKRARQAMLDLEEGFGCLLDFLDGGDESLLDESIPWVQKAMQGFLETLDLDEECLELDGGVAGTI